MSGQHSPKPELVAFGEEWPDITILVTSPTLGAGKSTLSAVIANALENAGLTQVTVREGEPHSPEYAIQYDRAMADLRQHLRENGTDCLHERRIVIVEKTVDVVPTSLPTKRK